MENQKLNVIGLQDLNYEEVRNINGGAIPVLLACAGLGFGIGFAAGVAIGIALWLD